MQHVVFLCHYRNIIIEAVRMLLQAEQYLEKAEHSGRHVIYAL